MVWFSYVASEKAAVLSNTPSQQGMHAAGALACKALQPVYMQTAKHTFVRTNPPC